MSGYPGAHRGGYPPPQGYGQPPPPQGYGHPPPPQAYSHPPPQQGYYPPPPQQGGYSAPPSSSRGGYYPPQQPNYAPSPSGYGAPRGQPYPAAPPPQQYGYSQRGHAPPPPSGMQQFGHGAPSNYAYQYSNCTGKRKALLIGINYFRQKGELKGCINDVRNLSGFLMQKHRFQRQDMVILTDDQRDPRSQPTRQNILRAMAWLVNGAEANDSLFFHFSGHGGQTRDLDGDEDDGYDEVIYPVDYKSAGHIVDDHLHHVLVRTLKPGVRLTAIFDSCHSGSALDLPYIYSTKGMLKEPNLAKDAGAGLLSAVTAYAKGDIGGVASSIFKFAKKATTGDDAYNKTMRTKTSPADVIMWSGSKDSQTSADATINSQATGAMSWAFMTALQKNPQQSYVELLNSIRDLLESKYSQRPQLSSSHPMDTNLLFII